jgi:hypothetical protein
MRAPLKTRVCIATVSVVVGDLIGSGEAQELGIAGEMPKNAARLRPRHISATALYWNAIELLWPGNVN